MSCSREEDGPSRGYRVGALFSKYRRPARRTLLAGKEKHHVRPCLAQSVRLQEESRFLPRSSRPAWPGGATRGPGRARSAGSGPRGTVGIWIAEGPAGAALHLAFKGANRAAVAGFFEAARGAGGKDNGTPGPRPDYSDTYYAAFVLDPDGNNVEAVTFSRK